MSSASFPAAMSRTLVALPVYNEAKHVAGVLNEVLRYAPHVLAVDDGSSDGTADVLKTIPGIEVVRHEKIAAMVRRLRTAFEFAQAQGYDYLVTIDCDGQHQPRLIPEFVRVLSGEPTVELPFTPVCPDATRPIDILSGSRYLHEFPGQGIPPVDRRRINVQITEELNASLGFHLTDTFCGFKGYRVAALKSLPVTDPGYAMPLELWVRAAHAGLRVEELPVHLIYLEEARSFGGALDDSAKRLEYYHRVIDRALAEVTGTPTTLAELRDAGRTLSKCGGQENTQGACRK